MADASTFDKIRIGIASPEQIRTWSHGEVKKSETLHYVTHKPERDGLFCERVFGPMKDWECYCGRYKKHKFKGVVCDRCGVEVTRSKVRRERMGHIELYTPVCHIWYLQAKPSPIALILNIEQQQLEKVVYFHRHIVTAVDKNAIDERQSEIQLALQAETDWIRNELELTIRKHKIEAEREISNGRFVEDYEDPDAEPVREALTTKEIYQLNKRVQERIEQEIKDAEERISSLNQARVLIRKIDKKTLLDENEWTSIKYLLNVIATRIDVSLNTLVEAGQGGAAIRKLLQEVDLDVEQRQIRREIRDLQEYARLHWTFREGNAPGPKIVRAIKRLDVFSAFIDSKSRPEWMILDCIPVISPEHRPIVQVEGGRFATSDLNDHYRRVINRNNRLKRLLDYRVPKSIVRAEMRLLQEAVDSLIENGRRVHPVTNSRGQPLKSLSDMLKGKDGRFRNNLLGKRVDYSGRSVIVVGPELKLHECGLPIEMALELFKPFIIKVLVENGSARNPKIAERKVDQKQSVALDALANVIGEHPVLLNRAPTLHRMGIQAFEPKLVDGKAIQLHPLACKAFNADFDGDQMAVHIPLSPHAQAEARVLMLASNNLFSPADGSPIVSPQQDIVLGAYYLTLGKWETVRYSEAKLAIGKVVLDDIYETIRSGEDVKKNEPRIVVRKNRLLTADDAIVLSNIGEGSLRYGSSKIFGSSEDAMYAYESNKVDLNEYVLYRKGPGQPLIATTVGRVFFNQIVPDSLWVNVAMDKKQINRLIAAVHMGYGAERTVKFLDDLKETGFKWATRAGITFALTDMQSPESRMRIIHDTESAVDKANKQYRQGMLSPAERKRRVLKLWTDATAEIGNEIVKHIDRFNPISMMTVSGARGSVSQIFQLSGMRGLMVDSYGRQLENLPVKSNFHSGLTPFEFFTSTHGGRKGLVDTAIRTGDAGYMTRRLVDACHDVIVRELDCKTRKGITVKAFADIESLSERLYGRTSLHDIIDPKTENLIVAAGEIFSEVIAKRVEATGIQKVEVRSVLTCESRHGVCTKCYGEDLSTHKPVEVGVAIGVIAAQSIGEPLTQLTMRTYQTGGIATVNQLTSTSNQINQRRQSLSLFFDDTQKGILDIDCRSSRNSKEYSQQVRALLSLSGDELSGLQRIDEIFEARIPKGKAVITEFSGIVDRIDANGGARRVVVHHEKQVLCPDSGLFDPKQVQGEWAAKDVLHPDTGNVIVFAGQQITEHHARKIAAAAIETVLVSKETLLPHRKEILVAQGQRLERGAPMTNGPMDPHRVLELNGADGLMEYLVREVQTIYKQQGVDINDKHIEVIVRQMSRKQKVVKAGATEFLPGQVVDKLMLTDANKRREELNIMLESQGHVVVRDHGVHTEDEGAVPGQRAIGTSILLGITDAALRSESFLSSASFQKTTRVLTDAAVRGKRDHLVGLKENVIIGRLIPAGTGLPTYRALEVVSEDGRAIGVLDIPEIPDLEGNDIDDILSIDDAAAALGGDIDISDLMGDVVVDDTVDAGADSLVDAEAE